VLKEFGSLCCTFNQNFFRFVPESISVFVVEDFYLIIKQDQFFCL
jgi:hypothetical protein